MVAQKSKTQKQVNVLYTYKFNKINRICFTVLSSNEQDQYNTCFNGDAEHGSCTCPGGASVRHHCYHLDQLKARAAEYFQSRQPVQPAKANPVAEAEAFIAKVQAEKAERDEKLARGAKLMESGKLACGSAAVWNSESRLHNSTEGHFEERGGRLVPMR